MGRVAVTMDSSGASLVSRVDDLEQHLDQLANDPALPTDNKLFDHVELQMTGTYLVSFPPLLHLLLLSVIYERTNVASATAKLFVRILANVISVLRGQYAAPHPTTSAQDHQCAHPIPARSQGPLQSRHQASAPPNFPPDHVVCSRGSAGSSTAITSPISQPSRHGHCRQGSGNP